ncbi:MAG: hypothetical protein EBT08_00245 [Betaproteobacteria bacterium]|nr:hypothetical protein [Betaproteobacteria bacterium]
MVSLDEKLNVNKAVDQVAIKKTGARHPGRIDANSAVQTASIASQVPRSACSAAKANIAVSASPVRVWIPAIHRSLVSMATRERHARCGSPVTVRAAEPSLLRSWLP